MTYTSAAQNRQTRTGRRTRAETAARRHGYAALALPVGLAGIIATPFGARERVGRVQRALAHRLLRVPAASSRRPPRVFAHSLVGLPVNLLAFALVVPAWSVFITRGVLYPLFGADHLERSWGGPTLAGAWVAHFIQGPPLLLIVTLMIWPLSRYQARLATRYLNGSS